VNGLKGHEEEDKRLREPVNKSPGENWSKVDVPRVSKTHFQIELSFGSVRWGRLMVNGGVIKWLRARSSGCLHGAVG